MAEEQERAQMAADIANSRRNRFLPILDPILASKPPSKYSYIIVDGADWRASERLLCDPDMLGMGQLAAMAHAMRQQKIGESEGTVYTHEEYVKLLSRHRMLLALLGKDELPAKLDKYFPRVTNIQTWILRFEVDGVASATDYSRFFGGLDRLHRLFVTLAKKEHFVARWISGKIPELLDEDKLNILTIKKESPGEIRGTAIEGCVTGLKDVLSVGKQIEDIRMSGVRVADAKLELERKQREMDEAEKKRSVQDELSHLDADIEREKKLLEIEQLRTQRDEELLKRRVMQQEDFTDRFARLTKTLKILAELPEDVKREVKGAFQAELEELRLLPITIKSLDLIAEDTSQS